LIGLKRLLNGAAIAHFKIEMEDQRMQAIMTDIDELLRGSVDMHLHHGPVAGPCRFDALELAEQAKQAGMRGIVLKDSGYPNAAMATLIRRLVPGLEVMGSLVLNSDCGGLNYHAVQASAMLGARVLWMPTHSSSNSIKTFRALGIPAEGDGISLLDAEGKLVPEMDRILSIVKKYDMVLASGHISPAESFALVEGALKAGIHKLVITHPLDKEFSDEVPTMDELKKLAGMGAFIELTFVCHLPTEFCHHPAHTVEAIREIGAERCIISTDLGLFTFNPPPAEGFRLFIATLLRNGITPEEIELMAKVNPAALLGLNCV
jgi:hypothetical protein